MNSLLRGYASGPGRMNSLCEVAELGCRGNTRTDDGASVVHHNPKRGCGYWAPRISIFHRLPTADVGRDPVRVVTQFGKSRVASAPRFPRWVIKQPWAVGRAHFLRGCGTSFRDSLTGLLSIWYDLL